MPVKIHKTIMHHRYNFAQFIGFYTAHMVWSLESGNNVAPLLSIQKANEVWFKRFESTSYDRAAIRARELFETVALSYGDYVLLAYDGFLTQEGDKREESLLIQAFESRDPDGKTYLLTVPFCSANSEEDLVISQAKIFLPGNWPESDKSIFLNNFKEGVDSHTKGIEFWNKHRDCNLELIVTAEY